MKAIKYTIMLCYTMTVQLEYNNHLLNFPQMLNIAINIYFTLAYYAGIMLYAFNCNNPLCSKLCWHNRRVPIANANRKVLSKRNPAQIYTNVF